MSKQKGKRFNKSSKLKNYFCIIFLLLISIIGSIFLFYYNKILFLNRSSSQEKINQNLTISNESSSVENIIENTVVTQSPYSTKTFETANYLSIQDLFLIYENNITIIKFNLYNNSTNNQDVFDFTFSLLDEDGITLISYDLSSKEIIESNNYKEFVLIATRDVSNAFDFEINMK